MSIEPKSNEEPTKMALPLFSEKERCNIVRGFILSYLRGEISIGIVPTKEEQLPIFVKYMTGVEQAIAIVVGAQKATEVEVLNTIDTLFRLIVTIRMVGMLNGKFLDASNVEPRITTLEEKVTSIEKLMEELKVIMRVSRGNASENMS